ncbi:TetR family transcriptional regulator [Motilibacter rhizosphaerae]|uniref:TetR family transcriptional regulator n=1 Tax=Motilibacter rhizosphaerae TaxID=598652 RepID=A0A4Q7NUX7_9ACTN|nr:TetR/AcrR family transcriptional regulator [Motilibacter rhizosphaerae]RZS91023.1 TetR family transcriptional regulator [Motilibacter rhizosphaerae]
MLPPAATGLLGLREQKKAATRAAITAAAQRLVRERGAVLLTVEEVAEAAGVSARTFHNYFASKEQAVLAPLPERAERFVEALRARPAGEPLRAALLGAFGEAVLQPGTPDPDPEWVEAVLLAAEVPGLVSEQLASFVAVQDRVVAELARRTGAQPTDLAPALLAAAFMAALPTAVLHWHAARRSEPLLSVVTEACDLLAQGLLDRDTR